MRSNNPFAASPLTTLLVPPPYFAFPCFNFPTVLSFSGLLDGLLNCNGVLGMPSADSLIPFDFAGRVGVLVLANIGTVASALIVSGGLLGICGLSLVSRAENAVGTIVG